MPQYYFHISSKENTFPDEEGVRLDDLAAAHTCAINIMYKTMLYDPEEQDWRGWMIKIADADGRIVLTLLYPSQEPLLRRTFGNRQRFSSHRLPLVGLVGLPPEKWSSLMYGF